MVQVVLHSSRITVDDIMMWRTITSLLDVGYNDDESVACSHPFVAARCFSMNHRGSLSQRWGAVDACELDSIALRAILVKALVEAQISAPSALARCKDVVNAAWGARTAAVNTSTTLRGVWVGAL